MTQSRPLQNGNVIKKLLADRILTRVSYDDGPSNATYREQDCDT